MKKKIFTNFCIIFSVTGLLVYLSILAASLILHAFITAPAYHIVIIGIVAAGVIALGMGMYHNCCGKSYEG